MNKQFSNILSAGLMMLLMITVVACGGNSNKNSETAEADDGTETQVATNPDANKTADGKLNINTASGEAFRTIPDVGDKMVHEFDEYRPYVSIQQFRQEIGKYVDEDQVAAYEEYIYVPIHRNDSDAATLLQIPGLNEDEANELIAGRPYATDQAFADALISHISEEELATAKEFMKAE